jgi:2'-5' RNA ligase
MRWVRADNLHVTVRFLGRTDETVLGRVREALEETGRATVPFSLTLAGLGGFPSASAPRVVWAAVTAGAEALGSFHARLEGALAGRGVPAEARPFHAHVTLGRARERRGDPALGPALARPGLVFGEVPVGAVHLMRSDLDPAGPRYGVVARVSLGHSSCVDIPGRSP